MGEREFKECIQSIRLDLLELFGRGYVIEHCVSAFVKMQEDKAFRVYVTDALKAIADNTARQVKGATLSKRFVDLITPEPSAEEIADNEQRAQETISGIRRKIKEMGNR